MIIVASVQVGDYCGRGAEYVAKLYAGIARHMPKGVAWRGVCLTDDPATVPDGIEARKAPEGVTGWWAKISLFKDDTFGPGARVLYPDLDTLVVGNIGDFAAYRGRFAIMRDVYRPERMQSSVMAWEAGTLSHIWDRFDAAGRPQFHKDGDQAFIESMQPDADRWQDLLPGQIASFKQDCWLSGSIPDAARMVVFHGRPRPHECRGRHIMNIWNNSGD